MDSIEDEYIFEWDLATQMLIMKLLEAILAFVNLGNKKKKHLENQNKTKTMVMRMKT